MLVNATGYMTVGELVDVQERALRDGRVAEADACVPLWMAKTLKSMFGEHVQERAVPGLLDGRGCGCPSGVALAAVDVSLAVGAVHVATLW